MLRTLDARHDRFGLSTPFRISRGVKTAADVVTVTIRQGDAVGRGEGVPYPRYGETVAGALAAIKAARGLIERGGTRADLAAAMPAGAARNAVDCALWDLDARLGGEAPGAAEMIPSAITIGIDAPEAMAAVAARHARVGPVDLAQRPIGADAALHTRPDQPRLRDRYAFVNIKLDKTGGLTEALALAEEARAEGFGIMVGCMVCSSLGIAPALRVARNAAFVDLDGPLWLVQDRDGGVRDEGGWLHPPVPGFWGGAD